MVELIVVIVIAMFMWAMVAGSTHDKELEDEEQREFLERWFNEKRR